MPVSPDRAKTDTLNCATSRLAGTLWLPGTRRQDFFAKLSTSGKDTRRFWNFPFLFLRTETRWPPRTNHRRPPASLAPTNSYAVCNPGVSLFVSAVRNPTNGNLWDSPAFDRIFGA